MVVAIGIPSSRDVDTFAELRRGRTGRRALADDIPVDRSNVFIVEAVTAHIAPARRSRPRSTISATA
jgi:hypothetical protein